MPADKAPFANGARSEAYRSTSLAALVMLLTAALGLHTRWLLSAKSFADAALQANEWLQSLSVARLSAQVLTVGPFLVLIAVVTAPLVRHGLPKSVRRSALLGVLLGACLFAPALLTSTKLKSWSGLDWVFFVPLVAPVLLGYQALIVWRQRPRSLGMFKPGVPAAAMAALEKEGMLDRFKATHEQLLSVFGGPNAAAGNAQQGSSAAAEHVEGPGHGDAYHPAYFVTNFAVPALLLLLVGFGAVSIAREPPQWANAQAKIGLCWGVVGAFVYVLIEFGSRFFRNDLSVGSATWAIVTLIVGPALAVLLAVAWQMPPAESSWQTAVVLFFAGLAPRRVVSVVESVALQFLKGSNGVPQPANAIPLTNLRGMTSEIALRLREENIADAGALAYADPIRLVQTLPYDLRQVVDWIDQAQLALVLPKHYETLRERGVTGAIDLSWRWLRASVKTTGEQSSIQPAEATPDSFKALVDNEQDAALVYDTAAQLFYEEQVCLLWVMYNSFSTTAGGHDFRPANAAQPAVVP